MDDSWSITAIHTTSTKLQYHRPPLEARQKEEAAGTLHLNRSAHDTAQLSGHISIGTVPRWSVEGADLSHTPHTFPGFFPFSTVESPQQPWPGSAVPPGMTLCPSRAGRSPSQFCPIYQSVPSWGSSAPPPPPPAQ